jgi:hypothetical protein
MLDSGLGSPVPAYATKFILPQSIVDEVNKHYFNLKGYCYITDMSFSHSDSKSKKFSKMTLCAKLDGGPAPGDGVPQRGAEIVAKALIKK